MLKKIDYNEVKDSFIVTCGQTFYDKKPRVGISPMGIWLGTGRPDVIIDENDNNIAPAGVLRWEWIKRIEVSSDISKDEDRYIVIVLNDFDAVWETIPKFNRLSIKSACTLLNEDGGRVLAYPAHSAFDFDENDYISFMDVIRQHNFTELREIGSIDEHYKESTGQKIWAYVVGGAIILAIIFFFLDFLGI